MGIVGSASHGDCGVVLRIGIVGERFAWVLRGSALYGCCGVSLPDLSSKVARCGVE